MKNIEAALAYRKRGWSVVPVQPGGKKPLVSWAEFTSRLPTPEEVQGWWTRWPTANIAVITGKVSRIVAVDVDVDRGGDPKKIFDESSTGLISRTGSGGFHLLYKYPEEVDHVNNRVGKDGIDIRGDGGYIVVPPSIHPNGNRYEFTMEGELGVSPRSVWEESQPGNNENGDNHWLTDLLQGGSEGGRNDSAARLAGYFAAKGMARDVAIQLVQQWNSNNKPPLSKSEIETTVRSVYKKSFNTGQSNSVPKNGKLESPGKFNLVPFNQFMTSYSGSAVRWCIEDWMPDQTIGFVVSPPGSYKTWLILDLAESVASGRPFLGKYPVLRQGPVVIVQQEDFFGELIERLSTVVLSKTNSKIHHGNDDEEFEVDLPKPDLPIYFHTDRLLKFGDENSMAMFYESMKKVKPALVIIDPLYAAGSVDDYMAKTAEQMLPLKHMRDELGCSFVIVHHTAKSIEGKSLREGLWGSQFLNAFLETGWQIRRLREGEEGAEETVRLQRHFKVSKNPKPVELKFDISTGSDFRYKVEVDEVDTMVGSADDKPKTQAVVELLEKNKMMTINELSEELKIHRSTVSRALSKLVETGTAVKEGKVYRLEETLF